MPRQQPRRTSYASTGSYTSFFESGTGSSKSSPPSPTSSSELSSSAEPGSPSPSPPRPSTRVQPQASTSAATDEKNLSAPRPRTPASKEEIAQVEQRLEAMYQATPAPVHSLKFVDKKKRDNLEAEMERIGYDKTLRKWWTTKQWAERRKAIPQESKAEPPLPLQLEEKFAKPVSTNAEGSSSKPVAPPKVSPASKPKPRPTVKKKKEVVKDKPVVSEEESKGLDHSSIAARPEPSSNLGSLDTVQASPPPVLSRDPLSDPSQVPSPNLQFIDPKAVINRSPFAIEPSPSASISSSTPIEVSKRPVVPRVNVKPLPLFHPNLIQGEEKDVMIEVPATTLCIGEWARRAAVDPSQLRVVYSSRTDSLVFSTRHLESVYHLHLPVVSISALVLFHSLVESRSYLLIHRESSNSPQPHFTLTSATPNSTSPTSSSATLIHDFTPSQQASTSSVYGLELEGTSLIPSLLQEIDSLSPSLKLLDGKLFVGPLQEDRLLTLEDLVSKCLIVQRLKKVKKGNEGGGESTSAKETGSYMLRYTGDDERKKTVELWTRKWCFSKD
ncbi:hypothetical protein JCM3765_007835 [Sporobolomyces pararoseus]